jgi:anaerobic selenocysteine-containing dehydrogenase
LVRTRAGVQQPVNWHDVWRGLREPIAGARNDFQILTSAHASLEELHVLKQLAHGLDAPISVAYTVSEKKQPAGTKFTVPPANAPNVNGARDLGLNVPRDNSTPPDLTELRGVVEDGRAKALYVFDPGPPGSFGDVSWIVAARESGRLPLLIVQGVVHSELTAAADYVLAGCTSFEKDASYTNDQGKVQAAATVMAAPGDAQDDCRILANVAMLLGLTVSTPGRARTEIASELIHLQAYGVLQEMMFTRPVSMRTWLQMSNPAERWKWDFLFQDLPPVKGTVDPSSLPPAPPSRPGESGPPAIIRLKPVD